jgi:hypothetical protein
MTLAEFTRTLTRAAVPAGVSPALAALWWAGKGEWDKAHAIVMEESGEECAWVHAYLHRVEGDLGNARYWYREAKRPESKASLPAEWDVMVTTLLEAQSR